MGYTAVPATTQTICLYASFLARSLKYNSVKQYLNIVRILHLEWGLPNPLLDNFHLRCVLQGMRRELGDAVNRKLPITPALLRSILSHLDMSVSVDIVVWAACLSLFHGLLRRSNLMPLSRSTFDASRHLRRRDIIFHLWGCELVIRWSKTIQYKSRCLGIPLPRRKDSLLCPVAAIFQATSLTAAACPDGPALVIPSPQGFQPLTAHIFSTRIQACLQAEGLPQGLIATHSFRRGGASLAYKAGVDTETIRQLGDWRSDAFQDYIVLDRDSLKDAVVWMQTAMD